MTMTLKRNAVLTLALALSFYWAFMFAKHNPALRGIIPFAEDPYDAVGSFAGVIGIVIALLSIARAWRPYRGAPPSTAQRVFLIRSQMAVVLGVLITVAADAIAMVRHQQMWTAAPSRGLLLGLLACVTAISYGVLIIIRRSVDCRLKAGSVQWQRAGLVSLLCVLALLFYPEKLIAHLIVHLLTVVIGAVILFAPTGLLLTVLVPYEAPRSETAVSVAASRPVRKWLFVVMLGIMLGLFAFLGELHEDSSSTPAARLALLALILGGLGVSGSLVAFGFLRKPLGLGLRD